VTGFCSDARWPDCCFDLFFLDTDLYINVKSPAWIELLCYRPVGGKDPLTMKISNLPAEDA